MQNRRILGFTLTEILVAIVVLAIGMLGLASLHLTSLRGNLSAYIHSHVTMTVNDLVERIRTNPPRTIPSYDASVDGISGLDDNAVRQLYSNYYCSPNAGSDGGCYICEGEESLTFTNTFTAPFTCASPQLVISCAASAMDRDSSDKTKEYMYCSDLKSPVAADGSAVTPELADGTICDDPVDMALHDIWTLYCGLPDTASDEYIGGINNLFNGSYLGITGCNAKDNGVCTNYDAIVTWIENLGVQEDAASDDPSDSNIDGNNGLRMRNVRISFQP